MFTFINRFTVTGDVAEFERLLETITDYMKQQPGFLTHRLYQSTMDDKVYIEMAEWDEAASHKQAVSGDGFLTPVRQVMQHAKADLAPVVLRAESSAPAASGSR